MGKGVLAVSTGDSPHLRSYAHCSKGRVRLYYTLTLSPIKGNNFEAM